MKGQYRSPNHRLSNTRLYRIWAGMKTRCNNPKFPRYHLWGGRGIKVCEKWQRFRSFYDDMLTSYSEHVTKHGSQNTSLDRVDTNGDYTKENCAWSTSIVQQGNRRDSILIEYRGQKMCLRRWAFKLGLNHQTLHGRVRIGKWPIEKAFNLKPEKGRNQFS